MKQALFSVIVPTVGRHDKYLPKLLFNLRNENRFIGEVIIVRSALRSIFGGGYRLFFYLMRILLRLDFDIKVLTCVEQQTAGQNRNNGWQKARFQFTAFVDADDVYHRQRLRIIAELLQDYPYANLILHLYSFSKLNNNYVPLQVSDVIPSGSIRTSLSAEFRNQSESQLIPGYFNLSAKGYYGETLNIPQGHATVRTSLRDLMMYSELQKGEDGLFCSEILVNYGQVFIISRDLSFYRNFNSSFAPSKTKKGLLKIRYFIKFIFRK